jgi:NTE family protein
MFVHSIRDDAQMSQLGVATKLNPDWDFLCKLRDAGRRRAGEWLAQSFDQVGQASSVDLAELYL